MGKKLIIKLIILALFLLVIITFGLWSMLMFFVIGSMVLEFMLSLVNEAWSRELDKREKLLDEAEKMFYQIVKDNKNDNSNS